MRRPDRRATARPRASRRAGVKPEPPCSAAAQARRRRRRHERLLVKRPQALLLLTAPAVFLSLSPLAALAARHRLPSISQFSNYPESGGLLAYGPNFSTMWRQCAQYVDRILKGAKIAEMPVERPAKFVLSVSVKTAKAIGLTVPPSVVQRADQVIE